MRVCIVDDHGVYRAGLAHVLLDLDRHVEIVEAGTAKEALAAFVDSAFDLALIDLDMPDLDETATSRLVKAANSTPVVGLSDEPGAAAMRRAFDAGIAGYLPKTAHPEVVIAALRIVLSGERYIPAGALNGAAPRIAQHVEMQWQDGTSLLTRRQRDIIRLLAQGRQNRDIATALGVAEGTVKVHVANIFKALKVNNRTAAAATAQKLGLLR